MLEVSGSPEDAEKRHFSLTSAMALCLRHTVLLCVRVNNAKQSLLTFFLEFSCFAVLCWFLPYGEVNEPHTAISALCPQ